jgi:hypothetical protein
MQLAKEEFITLAVLDYEVIESRLLLFIVRSQTLVTIDLIRTQ